MIKNFDSSWVEIFYHLIFEKILEDIIWNQIKIREIYHVKINLNIICIDILWYFDPDITVREKATPLYKEKNICPISSRHHSITHSQCLSFPDLYFIFEDVFLFLVGAIYGFSSIHWLDTNQKGDEWLTSS